MQKKLVRCYRGRALGAQDRLEDVWFTMPDFGECDRLYSCTSCGALFVADSEVEHYSGVSLQKRIEQLICPECSAPLSTTLHPYPQIFLVSDGSLSHFEAGRVYPPDSESIVKEVWNLYSAT
jgi:hypothetical protein